MKLVREIVVVGLVLWVLFITLSYALTPTGPTKMYRTYHPNGSVEIEVPLDSNDRWHGEMKTYHPSGRLRSSTNVYHGQMGTGTNYFDETPDNLVD